MGHGYRREVRDGTREKVFLLVVTDYLTKWVEAGALAKITDVQIRRFIWTNVFTPFGIPHKIDTDNGPQFTSHNFREFCKDWNINLSYSTLRHPSPTDRRNPPTK